MVCKKFNFNTVWLKYVVIVPILLFTMGPVFNDDYYFIWILKYIFFSIFETRVFRPSMWATGGRLRDPNFQNSGYITKCLTTLINRLCVPHREEWVLLFFCFIAISQNWYKILEICYGTKLKSSSCNQYFNFMRCSAVGLSGIVTKINQKSLSNNS